MMSYFQQLRPYLKAHRLEIFLGMVSMVAINLFKAGGPLVMRKIIDNISEHLNYSVLLQGSLLLLVLALLQGIALFSQERILKGMSRHMERSLRHDFYQHLQMLPLEFYWANEAGDLLVRATNDVKTAVNGAGQGLIYAFNAAAALACMAPIMLFVNSRLTILTLLPLLSMGVVWHFLNRKISTGFGRAQRSFSALCDHAYEILSAVRTVRAYNQDHRQAKHFEAMNEQYTGHNLQVARTGGLVYPLLQSLIGLSFITMLWYGSHLISRGELSIGQFVEIQVYLGYLAWEMPDFGLSMDAIARGAVSMRRVYDILEAKPTITEPLNPFDLSKLHGAIEFRHLSYKYPEAVHKALRDISFRIAPGQIVAVVGPVGCGKSTLMHLVARLLDADPGQLLIDDHPITGIPLRKLRSFIGFVPQETFLFHDTIARNIAFGSGNPNLNQADINEAALRAGIAQDIERFPHGYNTILGERGVTLSGGQRQRTSIARAIIRRPRILLLDDCFSAIDASTESQILKRLKHVIKGCTCLISSHRISTIKDADWIIVLDAGRIVEQGTHEQLLKREGMYAAIYERQLLEQELATA